jgi:hypothetical protein
MTGGDTMEGIPAGYGPINIEDLIEQAEGGQFQCLEQDCCWLLEESRREVTPVWRDCGYYRKMMGALAEIQDVMECEENCTLCGCEGENPETGEVEAYLNFIPLADHLDNVDGCYNFRLLHANGDVTLYRIKVCRFCD